MGMLYEYSPQEQAVITGISGKPTDKEIRDALAGVIGLIQLVCANPRVSHSIRVSMLTNHRFIESQRVMGLLERA